MEHVSILTRWHQYLDGIDTGVHPFYAALDAALERRRIPDARVSRVTITEEGVLPAEVGLLTQARVCVRVEREELTIDACATPFGNGLSVSWWLMRPSRKGLLYLLLALAVLLGAPIAVAGFDFLTGTFGFLLGTAWCTMLAGALIAIAGFLVRRRVLRLEEEVRALPVAGAIYDWFYRPAAHYRLDLAESFSTAVHLAVLEAIDTVSRSRGALGSADLERGSLRADAAAADGKMREGHGWLLTGT
jgi:hypothetical protein